jgi:hypothetical protein
MKYTYKEVKVADLSNLVPEEWDWFWDMLSSSNPDFSFGDNNLTLISGNRFSEFIDDAFEWFSSDEDVIACSSEEWNKFLDLLYRLDKDGVYINVESQRMTF